jgi:hypothetical protein
VEQEKKEVKETKKTHHSRLRNGDYEYLRGKILDIGCENDKLECGDSEVIGWDKYYDQTVLQATAHNVFIYQKIKASVG